MLWQNSGVGELIATIRDAGLLEPDPKDKDSHFVSLWRICPFLAWKGTGDALRNYLDKLPEDHVWFNYREPTHDL